MLSVVDRVKLYFYCFLYHSPYLQNDEPFTTSYIVSQPKLAITRLAIFIYCLVVLICNLVVNILHGAGWSWPAYFTTLTYIGITLYYGLASFNTCRFVWIKMKSKITTSMISSPMPVLPEQMKELMASGRFTYPEALISRINAMDNSSGTCVSTMVPEIQELDASDIGNDSSGAVDADGAMPSVESVGKHAPTAINQLCLATQWILYETCICYAPVVTLIYWGFLYPTQGGLAGAMDIWMGASMHAINTVLMILEIFVLSKCPIKWTHFMVILGFLGVYLGLAYFMVGVYGFFVYPFFDHKYFGAYIPLVCLLIVDIVAIFWVLLMMAHRWRDRMYPIWTQKIADL